MSSLPLTIPLLFEPLPYAIVALLALALVISIHNSTSKARGKDNSHKFPLLNPKAPWEISSSRAKQRYHLNTLGMTLEGIKKFAGKPFRVLSLDYGEALVLPPRYANEIKNDQRLSFAHLETKVRLWWEQRIIAFLVILFVRFALADLM